MAGVADIAKDAGVDAGLARRFVDSLITRLRAGERVVVHGLGSLVVKERAARVFDTPFTRRPVHKPARRVVAFKPSDKLLGELNPAP